MNAVRSSAAVLAGLALLVPAGAAAAAPGGPAAGAATGAPAAASPSAQALAAPTSLAVLAAAPTVDTSGAEPTLEHVDLLAGGPAPGTGGDAGVLATQAAPDGAAVLERELPTGGAAVVGLALDPASAALPTAEIRFRTAGGWQAWAPVELEDTTGQEGGEPTGGAGTLTSDAMVAAGADAVQVRLAGLTDAPLDAAELVLVDAGAGPAATTGTAPRAAAPAGGARYAAAPEGDALAGDATATDATAADATAAASTTADAGMPAIISRARWGANEVAPSADCVNATYGTRLDRFVVHHTAGTNSYSAADSPAILRGIQKYHVEGRGWCDVGYNVLVDKYGQVFEGRRGGLEELVVGVHASGHNTNTVGVSVLGDYTQVAPSDAAINALIHVIGWKSYLHGIDPASQGLKDGVLMDRVIGHREVAQTSCPGAIQNRLDEIMWRAREVMLTYQPQFSAVSATSGSLLLGGATVRAQIPVPADWSARITDAQGREVTRLSGAVTRRTTLAQPWTGSVAGTPAFVEPGTYAVQLSARSTNGKDFSASAGTVTLGFPSGFVAHDRRGALDVAGSAAAGDVRALDVAALGLPDDAAGIVVRVCSAGGAALDLRPSDQPSGSVVDTGALPDGCGLVLVGAGTERVVEVRRAAGEAGYRLDVVGYLPGAPGTPFWDVPQDSEFVGDIAWIAGEKIATGYADGTFRPAAVVSRQAMAAFLHRAAGAPAITLPDEPSFVDVPTTHAFYAEIEWMRAQGIANGTQRADGTVEFRPDDAVSRQATAAFLFRLSEDDPATDPPAFADVPATHAFVEAIGWLADRGITQGYADGTFRPTAPVTRQAMAAFLHRASAGAGA